MKLDIPQIKANLDVPTGERSRTIVVRLSGKGYYAALLLLETLRNGQHVYREQPGKHGQNTEIFFSKRHRVHDVIRWVMDRMYDSCEEAVITERIKIAEQKRLDDYGQQEKPRRKRKGVSDEGSSLHTD